MDSDHQARRNFLQNSTVGVLGLAASAAVPASAKRASSTTKSTIVLVPGAFHGGWYYSPLAQALRAAGHTVFTISLTGLGGPKERPHGAINLDTHIEDVVSLIELENLNDVILCGHSYGGMVIAGASDRLAGRIKTLVFFDALVPANGDSVWSTFKDFARDRFIDASPDGLVTPTPPGVDSRARPHPLATFLQPVKLSDKAYAVSRKIYVLCAKNTGSPFYRIHDRLASDASWDLRKLECGHDFMNDAPTLVVDVMRDILKS